MLSLLLSWSVFGYNKMLYSWNKHVGGERVLAQSGEAWPEHVHRQLVLWWPQIHITRANFVSVPMSTSSSWKDWRSHYCYIARSPSILVMNYTTNAWIHIASVKTVSILTPPPSATQRWRWWPQGRRQAPGSLGLVGTVVLVAPSSLRHARGSSSIKVSNISDE